MKNFFNIQKIILSIVFLGILLICGCSSNPKKNMAFERAKITFEQISSKEKVVSNAPVALHEARKALSSAQKAFKSGSTLVDHLSYIAEKKAEIAEAQAEERIAEKEIDQIQKEKQKILLDNRQREAEIAIKRAEAKAREAEAKAKEILAKEKQLAEKEREIEYARQQTRQLERELSDLQARQTERGLELIIGDVLFQLGQAELNPDAMSTIDRLASFLTNNPNRNIIIEGHTDSSGPEALNLDLSKRRAVSVQFALMERDISANRITSTGYGELYPIADNKTKMGRKRNRRVEIIILDEGADPQSMLR